MSQVSHFSRESSLETPLKSRFLSILQNFILLSLSCYTHTERKNVAYVEATVQITVNTIVYLPEELNPLMTGKIEEYVNKQKH